MLQSLVLEYDGVIVLSVHVYIHLQLVLNSLQLSGEAVFVLFEPLDLLFSQFLILLLGLTNLSTKNVICRGWLTVGLNFVHDLSEPGLVLSLELVGDLLQSELRWIIHGDVLLKLVIIDIVVPLLLLQLGVSVLDVLRILLNLSANFHVVCIKSVNLGFEVLQFALPIFIELLGEERLPHDVVEFVGELVPFNLDLLNLITQVFDLLPSGVGLPVGFFELNLLLG